MRKDIHTLIHEQLRRSQILQKSSMEPHGEKESVSERRSVITISRLLGTNGRIIAEHLAEKLGWSIWDKDLVDAIAKDADISHKIAESFDEKTVSEIEVLARTIMGDAEMGGFMYRKHLARALLSIATHGNAVILGRGSNFMLPHALNVRLIAGESYRVENLMKMNSVSREEARESIREIDKQKSAFIHSIYGRDIADSQAYDLTINVEDFGVDGTVEIIITALQSRMGK
jgi:cytidylate kinase